MNEFIEAAKGLLDKSWVGSVIGLTSLVVAFILYRAARVSARPVYQYQGLRLISQDEQALPEGVNILFRGKNVPRLTMNRFIIWNSGRATLDGRAIVDTDPLRIQVSDDAEILMVKVLRVSREPINFDVTPDPSAPNRVRISFDYLDPQDGAVVEIHHTDRQRVGRLVGTIRGVPNGVLDWGRVQNTSRFLPARSLSLKQAAKISRFIRLVAPTAAIGIGALAAATPFFPGALPKPAGGRPDVGALMAEVAGGMYIFIGVSLLWFQRRRFPKKLRVDEMDDL